jgi:hypothetical protein
MCMSQMAGLSHYCERDHQRTGTGDDCRQEYWKRRHKLNWTGRSNNLHDVRIDTMNWPARSPDLNPIEHLWDVVGKQVRARRGELVSLQELRRVVQEERDNTPQEEIQHLIESMPRRLEAVIRARCGNPKY